MSDREIIIQATRKVFLTGLSLVDAQVIVEEAGSIRPDLPYLSVKVLTPAANAGVAMDWVTNRVEGGGDPAITPRGYREATVSINAHGDGALVWLEQFADLVQFHPTVIEERRTAGVTYPTVGDITDLTALVDVGYEYRANLTVIASFEHVGTEIVQDEFLKTVVTYTGESPSSPSSVTMTGTIDPDNPPC